MKLKSINIFLKATLGLLVIHAVFFSDLPQYKNKAIATRVILYPLAAAATWIIYKLALHNKNKTYPYIMDISMTFVVAADLLGNTLDLYNTIWWWDDAMHFLLTIPWVIVFGYFIHNKGLSRKVVFGLVVAYGSTTHIIWEIFEYLSFVRSNPTESLTAYQDTIGDLVLSLTGTLIGALIVSRILAIVKKR